MIEIVAQVHVCHLPPPVLRYMPIDPSESHLGTQSGAKSVLLGQQIRLEDGANDRKRSLTPLLRGLLAMG